MKNLCKFTVKSPAASYIPLPRFLLLDEELQDISNDAKVLYALLLDRASISRQNATSIPTARFGCTSQWSRYKRNCTAAARVPHGYSVSWNTAV